MKTKKLKPYGKPLIETLAGKSNETIRRQRADNRWREHTPENERREHDPWLVPEIGLYISAWWEGATGPALQNAHSRSQRAMDTQWSVLLRDDDFFLTKFLEQDGVRFIARREGKQWSYREIRALKYFINREPAQRFINLRQLAVLMGRNVESVCKQIEKMTAKPNGLLDCSEKEE